MTRMVADRAKRVTDRAKQWLGPRAMTKIRCLIRGRDLPRWGNLRRTRPFSAAYGFDRGTPIDRYYLDRFLTAHQSAIAGNVLEVQHDSTARRYGRALGRVDTFDIVSDSRPTYLCDLAHADGVLPRDAYNCVLMPNTLQHLRELEPALMNALRALQPGGVLLASAAGFVPLTADVADYWRLSPDGWRVLLARLWPGEEVIVEGHGNCLAAVAAQMGLAVEEITPAELDVVDPRYPVLTTVFCRKRRV